MTTTLMIPEATEARAIHSRRALAQAADHGVALLATLGLPRIVRHDFVVIDPALIGDALDVVIAHLDALDAPDEDREPYLAGWYDGRQNPDGDGEADDCDYEDDGTAEPTLGAPERYPDVRTMTSTYYEPANGSYYRAKVWESQASWAQGKALDGEGESEAGYDLPEGDGSTSGEDDDDGISHGEHDTADKEPWLGSLERVNQTRWEESSLTDAEHDDDDRLTVYQTPEAWEASQAMRPALNAMVARANALRGKRIAPRDPDTLTFVRTGVMWWDRRHSNVTRVNVRVAAVQGPNLVELSL